MNKPLWSLLDWLKHHSSLAAALSLTQRGALKDHGWFRSVRQKESVDGAGDPIPWISYPALEFLKTRVRPEMSVFEFGSGNSTLWWARRVAKVLSCEADKNWHAAVQRRAPANVELVRADEEDYPGVAARSPAAFDVVVIDGGDRLLCAKSAVLALNPRGVILWDDTDRPEYQPGFEFLAQSGFGQIEFVGSGPIINLTKATSIFYRPSNIFAV